MCHHAQSDDRQHYFRTRQNVHCFLAWHAPHLLDYFRFAKYLLCGLPGSSMMSLADVCGVCALPNFPPPRQEYLLSPCIVLPSRSPFGLWRILETSVMLGTVTWLSDGRVADSLTLELAPLLWVPKSPCISFRGLVLSIIMKEVRDASVTTKAWVKPEPRGFSITTRSAPSPLSLPKHS